MFEDLVKQIEENLTKAEKDQRLQNWTSLLKQDLEIIRALKQEDINGLLWYPPANIPAIYNIPSGNLLNVLNQILSNLNSNLFSMINNPNHSYWQNWYNAFSFYSQLLHTILSDFGFDIKHKKEVVKKGISEVRKGIKQIEKLLKDVETQKSKIDEILEELNKAIEKTEVIEDIYSKVNTIKQELEKLEAKKNEVEENYQEFLQRKSDFEDTLREIEELKESLKGIKDELEKKQGRFDEFLENVKEDLDRLRQEQVKELAMQVEEGRRKLEEMEEYKEQAKQTLRWTEIAGLKTAYEIRAEDLEKKARNGFCIFILFSLLIAVYSVAVVYGGEYLFKDNGVWFLMARVALIAPALYLGWKLWSNYRETKLLADEYTHKKILAENLMIGAQTLKERLGVKEEETKEKFLDPTLAKLLEDPIEKVYKLKTQYEYKHEGISLKSLLRRKKNVKDENFEKENKNE